MSWPSRWPEPVATLPSSRVTGSLLVSPKLQGHGCCVSRFVGITFTLGLAGRGGAMPPLGRPPPEVSARPYLDASAFGDHDLPHAVEAVEVGLREAGGQDGTPALREVAPTRHWGRKRGSEARPACLHASPREPPQTDSPQGTPARLGLSPSCLLWLAPIPPSPMTPLYPVFLGGLTRTLPFTHVLPTPSSSLLPPLPTHRTETPT